MPKTTKPKRVAHLVYLEPDEKRVLQDATNAEGLRGLSSFLVAAGLERAAQRHGMTTSKLQEIRERYGTAEEKQQLC